MGYTAESFKLSSGSSSLHCLSTQLLGFKMLPAVLLLCLSENCQIGIHGKALLWLADQYLLKSQ